MPLMYNASMKRLPDVIIYLPNKRYPGTRVKFADTREELRGVLSIQGGFGTKRKPVVELTFAPFQAPFHRLKSDPTKDCIFRAHVVRFSR